MSRVVIGLDTSCYTTSAAAVTVDGEVIASCRKILPVPSGERGLRQSDGVFAHVRQLPEQIEKLSEFIKYDEIAAVCVSSRPRDDEDSYMPVFLVGEAQARALAAMLEVPCFTTSHQRGHIAAASVDSGILSGDLLALHLSGGTTELLSLKNDDLTLLGGTLDLHAGQVVDRTGVALGLPFPAGPYLEKLAVQGVSEARLPVCIEGSSCHLSGIESQIQRWIRQRTYPDTVIAREVYDVLARTVLRMILAGSRETGIRQALVAGGVASSALLRDLLRQRMAKADRNFHLCFGKPEYSGDNAVGVALIGAKLLREHQKGM